MISKENLREYIQFANQTDGGESGDHYIHSHNKNYKNYEGMYYLPLEVKSRIENEKL